MGFETLWQDVRYAVRRLRRGSFFTIVSLVLVAVSIGLCCAIFALFNAVALRALPVPHPEQLVLISGAGPIGAVSLTERMYDRVARERTNVSQIFGFRGTVVPGGLGAATQSLRVVGITGDFFAATGAVPAAGRFLGPDERESVAVISDALWRDMFAGDVGAVGRSIKIGTSDVLIVGVAPSTFVGMQPDSAAWDVIMPLDVFQRARGLTDAQIPSSTLEIGARLRPTATLVSYQARLSALWPALLQETVPPSSTLDAWQKTRGRDIRVTPGAHGLSYTLVIHPGLPSALMMTFDLALLLFGAALVTMALLAVAHGIRHQREAAIRTALGGPQWRLVGSYVIESAVTVVAGSAVGITVAVWWTRLGASFLPGNWQIHVDSSVLRLAGLLAVLMLAVSGVVAAVMVLRQSVLSSLRQGHAGSRSDVRTRTGMLSAQLAVSVVLAYYAMVYGSTLLGLLHVNVGFPVENLHVYELNGRLPQHPLDSSYFISLQSAIKALPGVDAVGLSGVSPPLSYARDTSQPTTTDDDRTAQARALCAFPGLFPALGIPVLSGRDLQWTDTASALVTHNLAREWYPTGDPLVHSVRRSRGGPLQIVGVVGDFAYNGPQLGSAAAVFLPCLEMTKPWPSSYVVSIMVRSRRGLQDLAADVRRAVDRLGTHYLYSMSDESSILGESLQQERMLATVSGAFGALAVLLTDVGLYAFCAYLFVQRSRELAIRAALGAGRTELATATVPEALSVLALGTGLGLLGAWVLRHVLARIIGSVASPPVWQLSVALGIVVTVAAASTLIPAIRATRPDLARILRQG